MNNKFNLAKNICLVVASGLAFLFSFVVFAISFAKYNDGWETITEGSEIAVVMMLVSALLIAYSVIALMASLNPKYEAIRVKALYICVGAALLIVACYALSSFFKPLSKAIGKRYIDPSYVWDDAADDYLLINGNKVLSYQIKWSGSLDYGKGFVYTDYQNWLYLGLVSTVATVAVLFKYLAEKKN